MAIKAIETQYKGYRFRSRLEARWAVFFDTLKIPYRYEEHGFEKKPYCDADEIVRWLPDFYLPNHGIWVEVKGGRPSGKDVYKMGMMLDFGSPMPFISESEHAKTANVWPGHRKDGKYAGPSAALYQELGGNPEKSSMFCPGVLLLGEVPYVEHGIVLHPFITHRKGLERSYGRFLSSGDFDRLGWKELRMFQAFYPEEIPDNLSVDGYTCSPESNRGEHIDFFTPDIYVAETRRAFPPVCEAYRSARAARFEHGERG